MKKICNICAEEKEVVSEHEFTPDLCNDCLREVRSTFNL